MGSCKLCGRRAVTISDRLGICVNCLRQRPGQALEIAARAHELSRRRFGLPAARGGGAGIPCAICGRACVIPEGGRGYCGLARAEGGRLVRPGGISHGALSYYYDPIPTNCVADWVCPATTGRGYPKYARSPRGEAGYYNLAVFYGACSLDCLYCQNWHFREYPSRPPLVSVEELDGAMDPRRVACVCFFGGDPGPQVLHALMVARRAAEKGVRVCWETNGQIAPHLLDKVVEASLKTGGIVKFDLKAFTPSVYKALTDGEVDIVLRNFKAAARRFRERGEVPLVVASILLVPGYVDEVEIDLLTKLVARVEPEVPTRFLAFHPDYMLDDLPPTSLRHAATAVKIARENGLVEVSVGNVWLLGDYY
jgi:pyruvate formate lyase activating enzyme